MPAGAGLQGMLGGRVLRKRKQVESRCALGWPGCTWLVWGLARHFNGLRLYGETAHTHQASVFRGMTVSLRVLHLLAVVQTEFQGLVRVWRSTHGADGECKGLAKLLDAAATCCNLVVFSGSGLSATSGAWPSLT